MQPGAHLLLASETMTQSEDNGLKEHKNLQVVVSASQPMLDLVLQPHQPVPWA